MTPSLKYIQNLLEVGEDFGVLGSVSDKELSWRTRRQVLFPSAQTPRPRMEYDGREDERGEIVPVHHDEKREELVVG